ncbi:hypothetical protein NHX12_012674 [Muraenolepis orangiensis]|uniref:Glutamate receptor n=1 Tax=Muraenolepis orangiensis TaxID=630683 RepID=A0A9Q0DD69_9TELE|nr:hypothetical protein NHX12_012674 [Muraenolepis orangiensis]
MDGFMVVCLCLTALISTPHSTSAKELSITTIKQDPYTMSRGSELEGYCIDLISEISRKLGFSYKVHLVKDDHYGALDASGSWSGMIGEVMRGEADLAVAPLTITASRERAVDMSTPFMQTGLSFLLRKDVAFEEHRLGFTSPFSVEMWVGVLIAFLLTGFCVFLVARISPREWESETGGHSFTLVHSFWYITGALTLQGAGPHPKALSGRLVSAVWWVFAILLLVFYFANFSHMQHDDNKHASIKNFEDLSHQDGIDYGTLEGGSSKAFFKSSNNPVYRRIYQHMERHKSYVASMEEGIARAQQGTYIFIGEAVSLDLAVARHCTLTRSEEIVAMRAYAIAGPLDSPLMKNLTVAILQLSESGELTYLRDKWWPTSCMGVEESHSENTLGLRNLQGLFILLGLGLGLGLLIALLELLAKARGLAKEGKKSCCSALSTELAQRFRGGPESADPESSDKSKA